MQQVADTLCEDRPEVVRTRVNCRFPIGHEGYVSLIGFSSVAEASEAFGAPTADEVEEDFLGSVLRIDSRPNPCCPSLDGLIQNWRWLRGCWIVSGYAFDDTHFLLAPQPRSSIEAIVEVAEGFGLFSRCLDTPGPADLIRYELREGSTILATLPTPEGLAQTISPLSGSFTVYRSRFPPPNTLIGLTITHIDLQGGSELSIGDGPPGPYGCGQEVSLGCINALTFESPPHAYMFAPVSINEESGFGLVGGEQLDGERDPPTFRNLQLCGGPIDRACEGDAIRNGTAPGYLLTISAEPKSIWERCSGAVPGPLPAPGPQTVFQLAEESAVVLPDGTEEPLHGSLLVSNCLSFNTFFAGRVEILELASDSFSVEGGCSAIGRVVASTLYGGDKPVSFLAEAIVNGAQRMLSGQGPYDQSTGSSRLALEVAVGAYLFRIVAHPTERRTTGAEEPLCVDWGFV